MARSIDLVIPTIGLRRGLPEFLISSDDVGHANLRLPVISFHPVNR